MIMELTKSKSIKIGITGAILMINMIMAPKIYESFKEKQQLRINEAKETNALTVAEINTAYASKVASEIMKMQENYLQIKFIGSPNFSKKIDEVVVQDAIKNNMGAFFFDEGEVIQMMQGSNEQYLNPSTAKIPERMIKEFLAHELGHYYVDTYRENNYLNFSHVDLTEDEMTAHLIMEEGIAEYFRWIYSKSNPVQIHFPTNEEEVSEMKPNDVYPMGLKLVTPILDRHMSKGLEYLICNPLSTNDLHHLSEYQINAMTELEYQDKNRTDWEFIDLSKYCVE